MQWIAPSEKDTASATLEKRLWDAADQCCANSSSDTRSPEQELRRQLIESRAVDVMVAVGPNRLCASKRLPEPLELPPISHLGNRNEIICKVGGAASSTTVPHLTPDAPSSSLPLISES